MSTISITIPQPLQEYVTEKVTELGLHQPEEYFVRLAEEKQKEELWAYYEKEVGKAIDADKWIPMDDAFWERVHQKAKAIQETRRKGTKK